VRHELLSFEEKKTDDTTKIKKRDAMKKQGLEQRVL